MRKIYLLLLLAVALLGSFPVRAQLSGSDSLPLKLTAIFANVAKSQVTHLTARLNRSEAKRIVYVALSRARGFLFVAIPSLSGLQQAQLVTNGFEMVRVVSSAPSDTASWERYLAARIAQLPAPG